MMHFSKKILSAFLALVLLIAPVISAFAESTQNKKVPFVYVHGFMSSNIYVDKDDPNNDDLVWPPTQDDILNMVKAAVPALLKLLVTKDYDAFYEAIKEPCTQMLCKGNLGYDGNPSDNSGIRFTYPSKDQILNSDHVSFRYDWRIDPIEVAKQLNDFIEYVCNTSGSDQVVLECHSFGGVVTLSYISLYGSSRLKSVAMHATAIYGEEYTGQLLTGNIYAEPESLAEFIKAMMGESEYYDLINAAFAILNSAGITGDLCGLVNDIIENIGPRAIKEIVAPMFAGWLSIWDMIPDEYIDDCMDYVFNGIYKNDGIDHSGLKEKIVDYNTRVRANKAETLKKLNETSNLYVLAKYGYTSIPLCDSWNNMSDGVVDTKYNSYGATCAPYGETLSADYINSHNSKYINPDNNVDASTCLFPDQTWFFRNIPHADSPDPFDDVVRTLLYYDGQATVDTLKEYPQFLVYDAASNMITADKGTEKTVPTFMDKMLNAFSKVLAFFRGIFDFIFRGKKI